MEVFYTHMEFIPGNIYCVDNNAFILVNQLNLDDSMLHDRYKHLISESTEQYVADFVKAINPSRSSTTPVIYCGTFWSNYYGATYHIVYKKQGDSWRLYGVEMPSLWHYVPMTLYNGVSTTNMRSDLASILKNSYQISSDKFRQSVRECAIEYTNDIITIFYYGSEDIDWGDTWIPVLSYDKKTKILDMLISLTKFNCNKDTILFLNAMLISLFSNQKFMLMTVEDDNVYELIQL